MKCVKLKTTIISSFLLFSTAAFSNPDNIKIEYVDGINIKLDQFDQFKISENLNSFKISVEEIEKIENSQPLLNEIQQEEKQETEKVAEIANEKILANKQAEQEIIKTNFGVTLVRENQEDYYFIETEVDKVNKSRDVRKAYLKAKSQLLRYLNQDSSKVEAKLSHFILYNALEIEDKTTFFFKVKTSNILIIP